jgi:aconitase A
MTEPRSASLPDTRLRYYPLSQAGDVAGLPTTVKILLEGVLRAAANGGAAERDVAALARYPAPPAADASVPFRPSRILLQDYTGVPAAVDLAAMRAAMERAGKDPARIEPLIPVDLIIDHSVQADFFGAKDVYERNLEREYERNRERYSLLRWAGQAFKTFRVVPPGAGICHQVNLERLAEVVVERDGVALPDTLFGADSHTTMVNGLGVLGWGVGGIEAEAAMLGQPTYLPWPVVVGVQLTGALPVGTTATDLVLTLTELFRKKGVVNKFIEFAGDGLSSLAVAERATVSNMCPEYGATSALFPVDRQTLRYLEQTGRPRALIELVERYTKAQGMFRSDGTPTPKFDELIEVDLGSVRPSVAGPKRPQDRVDLPMIWDSFVGPKPTKGVTVPGHTEGPKPINDAAPTMVRPATAATAAVADKPRDLQVSDGSVVIAAITSCTNTSNPSVMIAAGLLAKKAIERGLAVKPHVKTTFAPGSRVVTRYLEAAGLTPYLEQLGFYLVGFGCTVCIAAGTPVLQANGTSRRIEQFATLGGATVYGPNAERRLGMARQALAMAKGTRECVSLVLQDGRELVCTPEHEILTADGRWVRADELVVGVDRVVAGLEAPVDEPQDDENGYVLHAGKLEFTMDTWAERLRTLAFARLLGHLLDDGSISVEGQSRINVGQALDRETALMDIELLTGKRPAGTQYDERKWSIVLPQELTDAIMTLPGVRIGQRIHQAPMLPAFVLDDRCPVSVVREFLGGAFGADGQAPALRRLAVREGDAILSRPAYAHAVPPQHVERQREVMHELLRLLERCGVETAGAATYTYPVRRSASSYPSAKDGIERIEVRLVLPDGLSFVTQVGFRYCVDKQLRSSAAAVYWRTLATLARQRRDFAGRLAATRLEQPRITFTRARELVAAAVRKSESVVFPNEALFSGFAGFATLAKATVRPFRPFHRDGSGFPKVVEVLSDIGARDWFSSLQPRKLASFRKRYCVAKESLTLPTFSLRVVDRRPAGEHEVFDLSIDELHAFVAGTVAVSNCIGNTGPLATPEIEQEVKDHDLNVVSILSGNRNFEGRIHPLVKSSYLASPPLVVAFALAGTVHIDLQDQPIGNAKDGEPVFLKDLWPTQEEVNEVMGKAITQEMYATEYAKIFDGDRFWKTMPSPTGLSYAWDPNSTYVQEPPFFQNFAATPPARISDIVGARVLVSVGDSVTTDHISPAGAIPAASPAGQYMISKGVKPVDFNQYGTRRGNHEVLIRGTFANIRLRNKLAEKEGWWSRHFPSCEEMTIYDAAVRYHREGVPLLVFAGKEYGSGSSRDWAAKGPNLMGVRAAIAESFERIHRSNLVMMGILPLEFLLGETLASLGLTGEETFTIRGLDKLAPRAKLTVEATSEDGKKTSFQVLARVDDPTDVEYVRQGGILQQVLRERIAAT